MKRIDILDKQNVTSVVEGTKIVGGVDTGEPCVTVRVVKKENVSEDQKIPSSVEGVVTDVVEDHEIRAYSVEPTNRDSAATYHGDVHEPIYGGISVGTVTHGIFGGTGTY